MVDRVYLSAIEQQRGRWESEEEGRAGAPKARCFFFPFFSSFDDAFDESVVDVSGLEIRRRTEKNPNLSYNYLLFFRAPLTFLSLYLLFSSLLLQP